MKTNPRKFNRVFRNEKDFRGVRVSNPLSSQFETFYGFSLDFVFCELYQLTLQAAVVASFHLSSD